MRPGDSDELLSAYLDREVTPAERERVEAQLDASPDTRAELDALAELSLCLRTFDRPEAPPELKASVMQALAGRRIEVVTPPPTKPAVRRSRREWIVTITAVVTTACALFLAVSNWRPDHIVGTAATYAARSSESAHTTLPVLFDDSSGLRKTERPRGEAIDGVSSGAAPYFATMEANGDLQSPRPAAAISAPKVADSAVEFRNGSDAARPMLGADHSGLDKVALNDFLNTWAATDAPDRYVANIDLQVLDVRKAVDGFHVLLHKNGVEKLPVDEVTRAKQEEAGKLIAADAPAAPPLAAMTGWSDEGMVAVFVDTTADRVAKSLEELLSQKYDVVGVGLGQPLALARSTEDESLGLNNKEGKVGEKSQSRATTVDDVAREYVLLQQTANSLEFAETEGPADALVTSNTTSPENQQVARNNQLARKSIAAPNRAAVETSALRTMKSTGDNLRENLADSNARTLGMSLNYCSEVRLPLVNNFELATNNELTTNGAAIVDPKSNPLQNAVTNNSARNVPQQNQLFNYNYSGNTAQRYRQVNGRDGAPSVRVLVVFQDAPVLTKAKADRGQP